MSDVSNNDDMIDSRDVEKRIEELTDERDGLADDVEEYSAIEAGEPDAKLVAAVAARDQWDADNGAELASLTALRDAASGYAPDWRYGATLIRDSYFQTYAQDFAEELASDERRDKSWPYTCIDWDQAARELQQDYTSVEFDGVTYWVR